MDRFVIHFFSFWNAVAAGNRVRAKYHAYHARFYHARMGDGRT